MTQTERALAYFHRYQALILNRLAIRQPPDTLSGAAGLISPISARSAS